jgi:hypothetical protein
MTHRSPASVRRAAPHSRVRTRLDRERRLAAIADAEERARPGPITHEDVRLMLARRLSLLADHWRGCPERRCKRHRYCAKPRAKCTLDPAPDPTPLTDAQRANYDRIWAQMLAEREADRVEREREAECDAR